MLMFAKIRRLFQPALTVLVLATTVVAFAAPPHGPRSSFDSRGMGGQGQGQRSHQGWPQGQRPQNQEHLGRWLNRHGNLPLDQQQRALENEPGFRQLPPQTQQQLRNHLTQLNNMSPEQRQRFIEHNEAIERLTPPQREQFRGAMQQLGSLPQDSRRRVARTFRSLREMSPAQRQEFLNSERFRGQYTEQERGALSNLMTVEPYLPPLHSNEPVPPR